MATSAQVLRTSGLPSSEPGLLRMGADGPGGRELLRRVALGGHRAIPKPWRPGRQRRIRHRRLEDSRSLRHGLQRGLERGRPEAHRPFRRAERIRLRRDASRLRRGDARETEARPLPGRAGDPCVRCPPGRQGLDERVRIQSRALRGRGLRRRRCPRGLKGIPFVNRYDHDGDYSWNGNNYIDADTCRIAPRE